MDWHRVYDLANDSELISQMQEVSLDHSDMGLAPKPLVGSSEWWRAIEDGGLEVVQMDGTIESVFWGSMADYPMAAITTADGSHEEWTRKGDPRRYAPGLCIRIRYALHPWKERKKSLWRSRRAKRQAEYLEHTLGAASKLTLSIDIEESLLRSAWSAPGPNEIGLEAIRQDNGRVLHFLISSPEVAPAVVEAALEMGATARGGRNGVVLVGFAADDDIPAQRGQLLDLCDKLDCFYDGGEVVGEDAWPAEVRSG